jgi:hypothetical protein
MEEEKKPKHKFQLIQMFSLSETKKSFVSFFNYQRCDNKMFKYNHLVIFHSFSYLLFIF